MTKDNDTTKEDFHAVNNWLNKITTQSGMTRYNLEKNGFDPSRLEEEKENIIKLLDDVEGYALEVGRILKGIRQSIAKSKSIV
ncbi:MAG: hypothetical protein ABIG92_07440 [Candidatus Omnitrophota bacterium]